MVQQSLFGVQELLDHCIGFLHDSPSDLKACALVSRSWVYAAQAHIFQEVPITAQRITTPSPDRLWGRCKDLLHSSPHLIRHIYRLQVQRHNMSIERFVDVCNFPFTHLQVVSIFTFMLSHPTAIALQQLLSLPTLCRVRLDCSFSEPANFLALWERCSPGLKHLHLLCYSSQGFHPQSAYRSAPICLESVRITEVTNMREWLVHDLCPFNFSGLKVLSITTHTEILSWTNVAPALRTIEVLDFVADAAEPPIDLSLFENLKLLRMSVLTPSAWPKAVDALSTITSSSRIHTIVIARDLHAIPAEQLDTALVELPLEHFPMVELELPAQRYAALIPHLPRLSSNNMLRRSDVHYQWFESFV
ncbi:hypothetical protein FB451DRAFT_365817 [Mycena latifolia]|nr:hypothetical protein FB451DRAFT_365817 [Mycena latifolia]